jgi:soluble lytic murein transglycosylase-like protein
VRRAGRARLVRLLGLPLIVLLGGAFAWRAYEEPLRAVARDYLALRRVDQQRDVLAQAAAEAGLDPCLLAGLMVVESGGRVGAVSKAGAMGLFQLTRTTADWRAMELGLALPTDEELLTDPLLNARLGADNLAWLLATYDGDVERALCAYNAGARKLKELGDAAGGWEAWRALHAERRDSPILAYARRVLAIRDEVRERGTFAARAGAFEPGSPPSPGSAAEFGSPDGVGLAPATSPAQPGTGPVPHEHPAPTEPASELVPELPGS